MKAAKRRGKRVFSAPNKQQNTKILYNPRWYKPWTGGAAHKI
jgi:hypothetical protein